MPIIKAHQITLDRPKFTVGDLPAGDDYEYDLIIANIGYEARSAFILEKYFSRARSFLVSAYNARQVESYYQNLTVLSSLGVIPSIESDAEYMVGLRGKLSSWLSSRYVGEKLKVGVDISSTSRPRLARLVSELLRLVNSIDICFLYAPGKFFQPVDFERVLRAAGPVSPQFAGLGPTDPLPVVALLGLGYEDMEAMTAYQLLEPELAWAFIPLDAGSEYVDVVRSRNAPLIQMTGPDQIFEYKVAYPADVFRDIDMLVRGLRNVCRPVLVPLGPKIFALVSMLIAAHFSYEIPVWRFSSDQAAPAQDVYPSGEVFGLLVREWSD
jgi:hypothetical protein